jgi:hypothetical protein
MKIGNNIKAMVYNQTFLVVASQQNIKMAFTSNNLFLENQMQVLTLFHFHLSIKN